MGATCTKSKIITPEDAQDAEISKRIIDEAKKEKGVQKLLLLGAGESGKSTVLKQIKVLYTTGFNDIERKGYVHVIHANVYQSIRILFSGCKQFAESDQEDSGKYLLQPENQTFGEMLLEIEDPDGFPALNEEIAIKIQNFWRDPAIQAGFARGNELQLPDCTSFFLENVVRLSGSNYTPTQEDVLYARQQTTGVVELDFSNKTEKYRLFDVGGQRSERRKWIHLFDGVTAVIFCASLSEYDQVLVEESSQNRMIETKELFDWVLQQAWFEKTSFLLFLNKFDLFEQKVRRVPLSVCEWFKDYEPSGTPSQEVDHAYEFIKKKFQEIYDKNTPSSNVSRVFHIYKTTALDKNIIRRTFDLVDEALTRERLIKAGLL